MSAVAFAGSRRHFALLVVPCTPGIACTTFPDLSTTILTTTLPAQLSSRFNCDIVPIYISRNQDDKFEMEILDPIYISEIEKKNKILIIKKINNTIEKLILRDPSQWILTHNRWK